MLIILVELPWNSKKNVAHTCLCEAYSSASVVNLWINVKGYETISCDTHQDR